MFNQITAGKKKNASLWFLVVLAGIALLLVISLVSPRPAQAVDNCNLAALKAIVSSGGTLDFNCAADTTITLDVTWNPNITSDLTLTNTGAGKLIIDGVGAYQIFNVNSGKSLSITNLNLTGGKADKGGAIYSGADYSNGNYNSNNTVTVTNSSLYNNSAISDGGAIYNVGGTVTVTNSSLYNNSATSGGAICNSLLMGLDLVNKTTYYKISTFTLSNSSLYNNSATYGGAICNFASTVTVTNSSLYNNSATYGGAIYNIGRRGSNFTFGRFIYGIIDVTNSSLYNNSATYGGAIYNDEFSTVTVTSATFLDNTAAGTVNGGSIYTNGVNDGTVTLRNSLLQGSNICYNNTGGILTDGGYNLESSTGSYTCGFSGTSKTTIDAKLGTPGDNGGATPTIALLSGSPAIDAIPAASCVVTADQRGISRPQGTGCDIGAFEFISEPPSASDLIPQLRVSPNRVIAISPENLVSFSFKLKNIGVGSASYVRLEIPIPQGLDLGYLENASSGVWVTQVTTATVTIALPSLAQKQEASGTLVFRPNANAVIGTEIEARYKVVFDDEAGSGKSLNSNSQRLVFGETNSGEDGAIQRGAAISATVGEKVSFVQKGYLADEIVSLWYTKPDGTSVSLGEQRATASGEITIVVNTAGFAPGEYAIVGYGNRSEVTHVNILTIAAAS
ncbi:MAG: hypothetical protein HXX08_22925 [Chloroflexi bacterium]|uniref:CSLREA domain-containing protein n=1 Tax=Candidatus Chlorohelix allophototropha TaxID=3003348 RepID=A0A8T7M9W8_9CHLR|nr:hypothetical protein [Chloroflexota bacterium]WJW68652.1 hypothetical protein OZ401_004268 [Chloroflexota bacterium L227-S17]